MKGLSLTRRVGESCVCQMDTKQVLVTVEALEGNRVRLRFLADREIGILRTELVRNTEQMGDLL